MTSEQLEGIFLIRKHTKLIVFSLMLLVSVAIPVMRVNAASTITVNSTADDQSNDGECTLREAIEAANNDAVSGAAGGECAAGSGAGDTIEFDIPGAGPHTIVPGSQLPNITTDMIIDGTTETGYVANTNASPSGFSGSTALMIELDGSGSSPTFGLNATARVTIRGLVINDFAAHGIGLSAAGSIVESCYIGTNVSGTADEGNGETGINGPASSTIGGTDPSDRNLISGNTGPGIRTFADDNTIQGNIIGLNAAGNAAIANGEGIAFYNGASGNSVGGTTAGAQNVISGNTASGIAIGGTTNVTNNIVQGNYIGLASDGSTDLGNGGAGVNINVGGNNNTIGGTSSAARNIISGNNQQGVYIVDDTSDSNIVQGNYIGTDAAGTADVGNGQDGVYIAIETTGNVVGGDSSGERNVISGNGNNGVQINADAPGNTITGNYIGVDSSGNTSLGNTQSGVVVGNGSNNTIVGGDVAGEGNVIGGNSDNGITINDSDDNIVEGNNIGIGANGTSDVGNSDSGVYVYGGSIENIIGGTDSATDGNIIAHSTGNDGVSVAGATTQDNTIIGNSIYDSASTQIDLGDNGVTSNDANDADTGANDLLNKPLWNTVAENAGNTDVDYSVDLPAGDYRIEFFTDYGETFMESANITSAGTGSEDFTNTLTGTGLTGIRMTATEINAGLTFGFGPTSEMGGPSNSATSTIVVNSTADDEDDDGECTLREAITSANNGAASGSTPGECDGAGTNTIEFDIAGAGPHTIQPGSALPAISDDDLMINGYTETGAVENNGDYSACFVGTIMIEIDGTNTVGQQGLIVGADDVTIKGLAINRFDENGIGVDTVDGTVISGNMLGTDIDGLVDQGNGDAGVAINSTGDTMIGGTTSADRNLISGNQGFGGVSIYSDTGTVTVSGNCIGTDATGDAAIGNNENGINLFQSSANVIIGGNTTHERNVISGNDASGVAVDESSIDEIIGNYIGTNVDGNADLGNGDNGIFVAGDASVSYIGGLISGERNVVSGNGDNGIQLEDGAEDVQIRGNYIGIGADGTTDLGNTLTGLLIYSDNNTIGGTTSGARNVIAGNDNTSIALNGGDSNTVQGNYVGLDVTGLNAVTSCTATNSVHIYVQSNDNIIGGSTSSARNVIGQCGFATGAGVQLLGGFGTPKGGNTVQGNYIGTDKNGDTLGSTTNAGINIVADTEDNLIGGDGEGEGNLIRGMGGGIAVLELEPLAAPINNSIIGNSIYENDGGYFTSIGIDLLETPDFGMSLVENGVTANDGGDGDSGSNDYLNFPVIDSVTASTGEFDVQFDLDVPDDAPNGYRIEFFANDTGDTSGNGEGQTYLGFANVAGSGNNQTATITLDPGVIDSGTYDITATTTERDNSTDTFGATSEFSAFVNDQQIIQPLDNDGDGVNDSIEDAGPNGGDGNDDGTPDSEQANVATILDAEGDDYITLELDEDTTCNQIDDFSSVLESELSEQDPDYIYALTLVEFTIPCADTAEGTIYWHGEEQFSSDHTYRKFGPTTPGDVSSTSWYNSDFTLGVATIGGDSTATASFSLTDGELGDDTGNDDSIVDANGPGLDQPSSITETVSDVLSDTGSNQYTYLALAVILMGGSAFILKKNYL